MPSPYFNPRQKHILDRIDDLAPNSIVDMLESIFTQVVDDSSALSALKDISSVDFNSLTRNLEITLNDSTIFSANINETITNLSQDLVTGEISYTNENSVAQTASVISADAGNILSVGSDGGTYFEGQGLVEDATFNDATNEITITFIDGPDLVIPIVDDIGQYLSTTIYNADGTLNGDRIIDGNSHQITFDNNNGFYISNNAGDLSIQGASASIYTSVGNIDISPFGNLVLGNIQNNNSADRILAQDSATGVIQFIDSSAISSANIYTDDGTLTSSRTLDGDSGAYDLNLVNVNNMALNAISIGSYSQDYTQFESDGNVNLIAGGDFNASSNSAFNMFAGNSFDIQANESILAQAGQNINLFNAPDWSTTQDLEGILYSGDDVLGINAILGLAPNEGIKGAGFFTKRSSTGNYSYIFSGNTSDIGGEQNEIGFGMTDFGASDFNAGFSLTRDDISLNPYFNFYLQDGNSNYSYDYRIDMPNEIYEEYNNGVANINHSKSLFEMGFSYAYNNIANGSVAEFFYDENNQELSLRNGDTAMLSKIQLNRDSIRFIAEDIGSAIVNYADFGFESFSVKNLNEYSGGEKVLVHDVSGDIRKSIEIEEFSLKGKLNIYTNSATLSANETAVYNGSGLGSPFTHTLTLPAGNDKERITVKVYSNDVLRVDVIGGGLIDGSTFIDIDGTLLNKPSLTFYYSATLSTWLII